MNSQLNDFLDKLVYACPSLKETLREVIEYWEPENPPVTTLFSEIGRKLAKDFVREETSVKRDVFDLIEFGMMSEVPMIRVALATGLIEGAISVVSKEKSTLDAFLCSLGARGRAHARAWLGM